MEKVDLLIQNVSIFNSYRKKFFYGNVAILDGRFYYIDREDEVQFEAEQVIDGQNAYMIPGLIDIHMHIESSMMTPVPFCERMASCGVTTLVAEPHEIANVEGMEGIAHMIKAGEKSQIDVFFGVPSSVPSTSLELETTGAALGYEEMKELLDYDKVVCVGEIMNYRKVITNEPLEIKKLLDYVRKERPSLTVEGHCPSLTGLSLSKFIYLGIDGDHTEHNLLEVQQRIENGMFLELQDKMLKSDILSYIMENNLYEHCGFVTDDTMADVLWENGHLNQVVKKAAAMGMRIEDAIYCATYTNARRMKLYDRGSIAPGRIADFALIQDLASFEIIKTFKNGRQIYERGREKKTADNYRFPDHFYHSVTIKDMKRKDLDIIVPEEVDEVRVNVIEVQDGATQTKKKEVIMPVVDHKLQWKNSGCLLAIVLERHGKNGGIGYGFLTGNCLKKGAAATTYFHDHHNLFVVGDDEEDILTAIQRIKELQGGILTVLNGEILAELALPVAGILSDQTARETGSQLKKVRESLERLGYRHYNPIMSLCTLGLPVSPALKLTDKGLIDVSLGRKIPLYQ